MSDDRNRPTVKDVVAALERCRDEGAAEYARLRSQREAWQGDGTITKLDDLKDAT